MTDNITQLLAKLHTAVNNDDSQAVDSCYSTHAKVVTSPLAQPQQTEHDCVRALKEFQRKFMPQHNVTQGDEIVIEAGDVALVITKLYLVPKATPEALPCESKKAVYVMQRQQSGEWRCVIDNFFGTDLLDFA